MKIKFRALSDPNPPLGAIASREVEGERVKVAGWDNFQFVLHRSVPGEVSRWTISEVTSGALASQGDTKREAKDNLVRALLRYPHPQDTLQSKERLVGAINRELQNLSR